MKKWMILFVACLYLFNPASSVSPWLGWAAFAIMLVAGFFNIANAIIMQRDVNAATVVSMKAIMLFKLCLLPVYVFCLALLLVSGMLVLTIWFTIPALMAIPLVIAFSFFVLFSSSALAISRIILLVRRRELGIWHCLIHIALQLMFGMDVISCIILAWQERKMNRSIRL